MKYTLGLKGPHQVMGTGSVPSSCVLVELVPGCLMVPIRLESSKLSWRKRWIISWVGSYSGSPTHFHKKVRRGTRLVESRLLGRVGEFFTPQEEIECHPCFWCWHHIAFESSLLTSQSSHSASQLWEEVECHLCFCRYWDRVLSC